MKFARYYNVTKLVDEMIKKNEIDSYPTKEDDKFVGVYVCMDTNDFWISRISKDVNEDYDYEEGSYLVERNKFSVYDIMDKLHEMFKKPLPEFSGKELSYQMKNKCHDYFKKFKTKDICRAVIILDDWDGLSNWDNCEAKSLEYAIDIIDGGFGILPLVG